MSKKFHVLVPGVWFLASWFSVTGRCVLTWPGKGACVERPHRTQGGIWRDRITHREGCGGAASHTGRHSARSVVWRERSLLQPFPSQRPHFTTLPRFSFGFKVRNLGSVSIQVLATECAALTVHERSARRPSALYALAYSS